MNEAIYCIVEVVGVTVFVTYGVDDVGWFVVESSMVVVVVD